MSTLASVGNCYQPFHRLLNEVERLAELSQLPMPVNVQYGHTPFSSRHCNAIQFLDRSEFESRVAEAELVIMHAGAGSVLQAVHAGRVPVVMARRARYGEHIDDHQTELARTMGASGRLVLAEGPEDLGEAIRRALYQQAASDTTHGGKNERVMLEIVRQTLKAWHEAPDNPRSQTAARRIRDSWRWLRQ